MQSDAGPLPNVASTASAGECWCTVWEWEAGVARFVSCGSTWIQIHFGSSRRPRAVSLVSLLSRCSALVGRWLIVHQAKYGDSFIRGNNILYISTQKRKAKATE